MKSVFYRAVIFT